MISMKEIWKDIEGYEGYYQVSNLGGIRSLDRVLNQCSRTGKIVQRKYPGQLFKCTPDLVTGYVCVSLQKGGQSKSFCVHRLVAEAFIPNPDNLPQVNHKDENTSNNCADNLEWCTNSYNINYGHRNEKVSKALTGIKRRPESIEKTRKSLLGRIPWNKGFTSHVTCLDEGIEFSSTEEAAEWVGKVKGPAIKYACKHIACSRGHVFVYTKDIPEDINKYVYECYKHSGRYPELEEKWRLKVESEEKEEILLTKS